MAEINYEKILTDRSMIDEKDFIVGTDNPAIRLAEMIAAMKSAVSAAIPILLGFCADNSEVHIATINKMSHHKKYTNNDTGTEVTVSKESILSLADSIELKQKLGIEK